MDPTAPNDNQQNPEGNANVQNNPVQPGQFVVSGEQGAVSGDPGVNIQQPNLDPQSPVDNTGQQMPPPPGPVGSQLAGESPPMPQNDPAAVNPQFAAPTPAFSAPVNTQQPDTTPFAAAPGAPMGPQAQGSQVPPDSDSKMAKLKIVAIIAAILILVAIIVALVWFFVLNKKSNDQVNINTQQTQVEEPTIPSPQTESGFGDIPPATEEAAPPATEEPITPSPQVPL